VRDYQFKPDFVWIKGYTDPDKHGLYDTVRGATKRLVTSLSAAQETQNGVMSFDDKGFSVGNYAETNGSGRGYVAWSLKAGGNKGTYNVDGIGYASASDAGLTGAVNCTQEGASVGTKQGFSITVQEAASGSGDTMQIPHGLTQKPDFIIGKDIDTGSTNWGVYHSALGAANKIELDSNAAAAANANYWDETEPTSSVIYTNAASWMYTSSSFVMYSWHNVPGLQKFGSYTGNSSADGPFIELGFSPAIVIIRKYNTGTNDWYLFDDKLNKYNLSDQYLCPNLDNAKTPYSNVEIDMLSNGFKIRNAEGSINAGTMLYAAWAHQPMNNLYGAQSNAR